MLMRALLLGLLVGLASCTLPPITYHTQAPTQSGVLDFINRWRDLSGIPHLEPNATLQRVAQEHADDMVQNEYFGKRSPSGITAGQRLENTMLGRRGYGILLRVVPRDPEDTVVQRILGDDPDGWLKNNDDLSYLRNPRLRYAGLGISYHPRDDAYYVTLFMSLLGQPSFILDYGRRNRR